MNRIRWLILILGPLPIVGSSWAVSAWFKPEPRGVVMRNSLLPSDTADSLAPPFVPDEIVPDVAASLAKECKRRAESLSSQLGSECQVLVRSPFVLAGDLSQQQLEALYDETIAPAVRALRNRYFETPPEHVVTVLLFSGEQSYNQQCESLFGDRGISIYGYYKPNLRTLVLNIATGQGTLLHELSHALIDFDFPDAPDWLNEGLASLHEQSRFRNEPSGTWIEGLVNWRLKGLQEVVAAGELNSLGALIDNPRFRGPGEGTNYAQARFFCLYMQERGVLADFYRNFRRNYAHDPRGQAALAQAFPGQTPAEVDEGFRAWVLDLKPAVQ